MPAGRAARPGERAGIISSVYPPGGIRLARRVVVVLGGRYSAELGIDDRYDGQVAVLGRRFTAYPELHAALDALPGWGPVTVGLFLRELRELRGVWPGADPPLDEHAAAAARHLGLASAQPGGTGLTEMASAAGLDVRDLESWLVRLDLAHGRATAGCPGGQACTALRQPVPQEAP